MSDEVFAPSLWLKVRLIGVVALMTGCLGLLGYRAYVLQVEKAPELRSLAEEQHQNELELQGRRGRILDRVGLPLAASTEPPGASIAGRPSVGVTPPPSENRSTGACTASSSSSLPTPGS